MAKVSRCISLLIRVGIAVACAIAAIIMGTSHDSTSFFGITMDAKFQYTPSFTYFVIANAVASVYNILVVFVPPGSTFSGLIIITDVIMEMLLTGAMGATGALSELGKKGNSHAGWLPTCTQIPKYCDHVMGSLISGFVALVVFLLVILYNIYKVISLDSDLHLCTR